MNEPHIVSEPINDLEFYRRYQMLEASHAALISVLESIVGDTENDKCGYGAASKVMNDQIRLNAQAVLIGAKKI